MSDSMRAPARQEPALASLPLRDDDLDTLRDDLHRRPSSRGRWIWAFVVVAIAAAAIGAWRMQSVSRPPPAPAAEAAPAAAPATTAEAPPAIRYPIDAARTADASVENQPAPAASSDATVLASLFALPGAAGLDRLIVTEDFVHRFVATIDNLPRASVASKVMAVRPAEGAFAIDLDDGRTSLGRGNASRYAPYLRTLQAADTRALVALYVRNYSLFQQAYRDLGYPNGYFNDRLVDVIDHLLAAPEPVSLPTLLQPRVLYEYANPDFEARSAGQKAMLRLGPESERAAKAKLREIRQALTAAPARP